MQFSFTPAEIESLMLESPTFRQKLITALKPPVLDEYRALIRSNFPDFNRSQKIAAIKWLRDTLRDRPSDLREFDTLCSQVYPIGTDWKLKPNLGLAAAKAFVESC